MPALHAAQIAKTQTRQRKLQLVIHVMPHYPVSINRTCRYCPDCDLLIVHQDEREQLLASLFERYAPKVIGNDYLVISTQERDAWTQALQEPLPFGEMLNTLPGFKQYLNYDLVEPAWITDENST